MLIPLEIQLSFSSDIEYLRVDDVRIDSCSCRVSVSVDAVQIEIPFVHAVDSPSGPILLDTRLRSLHPLVVLHIINIVVVQDEFQGTAERMLENADFGNQTVIFPNRNRKLEISH